MAAGGGLAYNAGRFVTAAGVLMAGTLLTTLGDDSVRVGSLRSLVYAPGIVAIWLVPRQARNPRAGHRRQPRGVPGRTQSRRSPGVPAGDPVIAEAARRRLVSGVEYHTGVVLDGPRPEVLTSGRCRQVRGENLIP